jgi:hypothetical protein
MLIRALRTFILFLLVLLFGCQSPLWESFKQSTEQDSQRIAIQQAFDDAGLTLHPPTPGENHSRYRCKTRYFEIIFPPKDAGLALHLASQADFIYKMMKAWFGYGLPYDSIFVRTSKLDGGLRVGENMTWEYRMINLRGGPRPKGIMDIPQIHIPPLVSMPLELVTQHTTLEENWVINHHLRTNRFVFAYKVACTFCNRKIHPITDHSVPWWFRAGIAGYLATEERDDPLFAEQLLVEVGIDGRQLSLNQLPESTENTWPSYRTALSFLLFLHHRYGEETIREMFQQVTYAQETTFEGVIFSLYGKTTQNLEVEWREAVKEAIKKVMPSKF